MSDLPFRTQAGSSAASGSSGDTSHNGPGAEQAGINGSQGGAPGGRWPQDDLPVGAQGAGWTEGFSPSPENAPLPSSHTDGVGLTPAGTRR